LLTDSPFLVTSCATKEVPRRASCCLNLIHRRHTCPKACTAPPAVLEPGRPFSPMMSACRYSWSTLNDWLSEHRLLEFRVYTIAHWSRKLYTVCSNTNPRASNRCLSLLERHRSPPHRLALRRLSTRQRKPQKMIYLGRLVLCTQSERVGHRNGT